MAEKPSGDIRGLWLTLGVYLLGRSPGPAYLAQLERLARSVPGVLAVGDARAETIGPQAVHASLNIVVARGLPVEEANRIAHEVEARVHAGAEAAYCEIHVDPAPAPEAAAVEDDRAAVM